MLPLIPVFLKANGIAEKDVEIISASENAFLGLMTTKQVDAVSQTPEKIAVPLSKQGIESNNMYFFDNGVPVASLSLVAREDRISEKGEAIKRFIQATAEGWVAAMQDPQSAIKDLKTAFPETENDPEALLQASFQVQLCIGLPCRRRRHDWRDRRCHLVAHVHRDDHRHGPASGQAGNQLLHERTDTRDACHVSLSFKARAFGTLDRTLWRKRRRERHASGAE